jgi:hypothetical protein
MASRAASIEHDNKIGRIGAYHLFRLPIAEEAAVHDLLRSPQADAVLQSLADLSTREQRLDALSALAGAESVVDAQGPLYCGSPAGLRRNKVLQHLCAAYVDALRHGTPVYPYLLEEVP